MAIAEAPDVMRTANTGEVDEAQARAAPHERRREGRAVEMRILMSLASEP